MSDALYDEARAHFTEKELVDLTVAVIAINAWNRLAVTFRPAVGNYKPAVDDCGPPAASRQPDSAIDSSAMGEDK